jgi:hypothetical protein
VINACVEGFCQPDTFVPFGELRVEGMGGANDCRVRVCDGVGGYAFVEDLADCDGVCVDGVCEPVVCTAAGDCPTPLTPCYEFTCDVDGYCARAFTPSGFFISNSVTGDCRHEVCDGTGRISSVQAGDDVPEPPDDPCQQYTCEPGVPTLIPSGTGTPCTLESGAPGACLEGTCETPECEQDEDCEISGDPRCSSVRCESRFCLESFQHPGFLLELGSEADCGDLVCDGQGGTTTIDNSIHCPGDGQECCDGTCTVLETDRNNCLACGTVCDDFERCDSVDGCVLCDVEVCAQVDIRSGVEAAGAPTDLCTEPVCLVDGSCGIGNVPAGTVVRLDLPPFCSAALCDGSGGSVIIDEDAFCDAGEVCREGLCRQACTSNLECNVGDVCDASFCSSDGVCVIQYVGSGPSVNEVAGDCVRHSCVFDSPNEIVTPDETDVPVSEDPCLVGVCIDGAPSFGPAPGNPPCPGGICDGLGNCVECLSRKDCDQATNVCVDNTCVEGLALEAACSTNDVCLSGCCRPEGEGVCVDGSACFQ